MMSAPERLTGGDHGNQAATNSILSFRPNTRAALPSVDKVTEGLEVSSKRSSAARLVRIRLAMAFLDRLCDFISFSNCNATARFAALSSTSSRIPSSLRKSSKLLPRYLFLFMAHSGMPHCTKNGTVDNLVAPTAHNG